MKVERRARVGYDWPQVLATLQVAEPRSDMAVFLYPDCFASTGVGPVRKAGRTSTCVLLTTPTTALASSAKVSSRSNLL